MRIVKLSLAIAVPTALTVWLCYTFWYAYQPEEVQLQGQIEAEHYSISSKVAGRVDEVLVRKGDMVEKGQLIFTIHSPEVEARLKQAMAGRETAAAMAQKADKGAREQEIETARDQWQQAKAKLELMEKTYRRINTLFNEGVVPEQQRDETYAKLQSARFDVDSAFQMFQMAEEGTRQEEKLAAAGNVRKAEGAVAEVEAYAADTRITSWHRGEVAQVFLRSGELAPQGFPVVTIIDMDDAWAVFHVREDRLSEFEKGQEFEVVIPALGQDSHTFRVDHIAVMGDFATWRATTADSGFDMRSFEVEARPVSPLSGLRAGMSVLIQ